MIHKKLLQEAQTNGHNLYILQTYGPDNASLYKLGYSSYIPNRIQSYKNANPYCQLLETAYTEKGIEYEEGVHRHLTAAHGREWYLEEDLPALIEALHSRNPEIRTMKEHLLYTIEQYGMLYKYTTLSMKRLHELANTDSQTVARLINKYPSIKHALYAFNQDKLFSQSKTEDLLNRIIEEFPNTPGMSYRKLEAVYGVNKNHTHHFIKIAREYHGMDEYAPTEIFNQKKKASSKDVKKAKKYIKDVVNSSRLYKITISEVTDYLKEEDGISEMDAKRAVKKAQKKIRKANKELPFRVKTIDEKFIIFKSLKDNKDMESTDIMKRFNIKWSTAATFMKLTDSPKAPKEKVDLRATVF